MLPELAVPAAAVVAGCLWGSAHFKLEEAVWRGMRASFWLVFTTRGRDTWGGTLTALHVVGFVRYAPALTAGNTGTRKKERRERKSDRHQPTPPPTDIKQVSQTQERR